MPPLVGPRITLWCTRYPVKTRTDPSSMLTGKWTVSSRCGVARNSWMPRFSDSRPAAWENCRRAISHGSSTVATAGADLWSAGTASPPGSLSTLPYSTGPLNSHPELPGPDPHDRMAADTQGREARMADESSSELTREQKIAALKAKADALKAARATSA